jgi:hypothetical protein
LKEAETKPDEEAKGHFVARVSQNQTKQPLTKLYTPKHAKTVKQSQVCDNLIKGVPKQSLENLMKVAKMQEQQNQVGSFLHSTSRQNLASLSQSNSASKQ